MEGIYLLTDLMFDPPRFRTERLEDRASWHRPSTMGLFNFIPLRLSSENLRTVKLS